LGECEEFSAKGWQAPGSAGRSWQSDRRLPRGEAVKPDARIEDAKLARKGKGKEAKFIDHGIDVQRVAFVKRSREMPSR
jgi:hypothetical protein